MNSKQTELLSEAKQILHILHQAGHEAYMVGGFVRDYVLGKPVHDIDIATSAAPADVIRLFARTVPTGIQHGTVTVLSGTYSFEVTTFRQEGKYEDHRRPEHVWFVQSLEEDLARRDFTMNAMAMNIEGRIIDPFGGQADLQAGILRCVGDAHERFKEDALRMLRCIRFAANYDLRIAKEAWEALMSNRMLLRFVAMERVRIELEKTICGTDALRGAELLARSQLLAFTKEQLTWEPFTTSSDSFFDKLKHHLSGRLNDLAPSLRLPCLLQASGMLSKQADVLLRQLTYSNEVRTRTVKVLALSEFLMNEMEVRVHETESDEKVLLRRIWVEGVIKYGQQAAEDLLSLRFLFTESGWQAIFVEHATKWYDRMTVYNPGDLVVNGHEVAAQAGVKGKWIGIILQQLTIDTALGYLANNKHELLNGALHYAKKWGLS